METRTLQVNPEDTGTRLDAWLAGQLPDVTRSAAARLCEEGRVTAAGKPLAKNYRLGGGEAVSVTLPDPEPVDVAPQDIPLPFPPGGRSPAGRSEIPEPPSVPPEGPAIHSGKSSSSLLFFRCSVFAAS